MKLSLHRCTICGTRWLLWPDDIHGGGWNLLDHQQRPGACCDNVAMGEQIEHLRDFDLFQTLRAEERRPQEWQPIETAPKDGSWIVVTSATNKYARGVIQWVNGAWCDWSDEAIELGSLSHWMPCPLPAPPGAAVEDV